MIFKNIFENDNEISIQGYGKSTSDSSKKILVNQLHKMAERLERSDDINDLENVYYTLYTSGVFERRLKALINHKNKGA